MVTTRFRRKRSLLALAEFLCLFAAAGSSR
jgi:hypothetical protein